MKQYIQKPVVVHAQQIKDADFDKLLSGDRVIGVIYDPELKQVFISTFSGVVTGYVSDWIIRDQSGEFRVLADDVFCAFYSEFTGDLQNNLQWNYKRANEQI